MDAEQVKQIIEQQLVGTQVIPSGEGCSFQVTVIGDLFIGLSPVKKQQLVYSCLTDQIADGSIHALGIKTYTADQWQSVSV
ncbi:BolA family transcriptional regulator [Oceanospirillaceae bacterium]|uniref:BolA family protein n=1 Tax=Candidatus Njordibacter sp. Uisw_002 TaxID=3230971 RepID=UPI00237313A2|nr:BolA family transcriptional regulator [Oceanospirillaceae bacterium]MDB9752813.1 BolA family transcriptional regulator [Oceanospirillaceae bacterium]MDC1340273.1 BolA family transcriptional regulator [Oceanospirillaceae bacterium]